MGNYFLVPLKIGLLSWLSLCLIACSVLSPVSPPPVKTYLLQDSIGQAAAPLAIKKSNTSRKVLYVSDIISPAWLNTTQMAYQQENQQINYFARHQWAAPPADLLQPVVIHALSASGFYRAVVSSPFNGQYDQRLEMQLLEMQQDFFSDTSTYVMTVQAQLVNKISQKIIASQRFHFVVPVSQRNPESGVKAANEAVNQWIPQLIQFVNR